MQATYEKEITENLGDDRSLILLGVRADADIHQLNKKRREIVVDVLAMYKNLRDAPNEATRMACINSTIEKFELAVAPK
jgi:hypothetical protein